VSGKFQRRVALWRSRRSSATESSTSQLVRNQKIHWFKILRELRPEFPGVDSEWQNNYPKGTIQIESNNTYEYTNPNLN